MNIKLQPNAHTPGSIFSFVPAHEGSRAAAVAKRLSRIQTEGLGVPVLLADFDTREYSPRRLKSTWDALVSDVDGVEVLDVNGVPPTLLRPVLESAREKYSVVCADLTGAVGSRAAEVLRASDGIFLVAGSDRKSLEGVGHKLNWLRSLDLAERCGLLLADERYGARPSEVEDLTGIPVCSLIDTPSQLEQLAAWLAAGAGCGFACETPQYAVAV